MSKLDILYVILSIALLPSLWLLAAILDRVWLSNVERQEQARRQEQL
jgi:hypothetical protein